MKWRFSAFSLALLLLCSHAWLSACTPKDAAQTNDAPDAVTEIVPIEEGAPLVDASNSDKEAAMREPDISNYEITFLSASDERLSIPASQCGLYAVRNDIRLYEEQFDALCTHLAAEFNREATDAAFSEDGGSFAEPFAIAPEQNGRELDVTALRNLLLQANVAAGNIQIDLPFIETIPKQTEAALMQDRVLLAEYATSFDSSGLKKAERVHNLEKAAALLNGTVLQPDETGYLNEILGERNKKNGWKMANAISGGIYVEEYGGGVCQVSSTLFNVWMLADLEVVKRYHHSWPMSYVPAGRDATITTGQKDFVFKNNSEAPLYIFAAVDKEALTVSVKVYGKKTGDWASIEIKSETIKELAAPDTIIKLDESLPAKTKEEHKRKRDGRITRTWRIYKDADGKELSRNMLYEDTYSPVQGITYVSADLYY